MHDGKIMNSNKNKSAAKYKVGEGYEGEIIDESKQINKKIAETDSTQIKSGETKPGETKPGKLKGSGSKNTGKSLGARSLQPKTTALDNRPKKAEHDMEAGGEPAAMMPVGAALAQAVPAEGIPAIVTPVEAVPATVAQAGSVQAEPMMAGQINTKKMLGRFEIAELAQGMMPEAVKRLGVILQSSSSDLAALQAFRALKETAYGKDMHFTNDATDFEALTNEQLKDAIRAELEAPDAVDGFDAEQMTQTQSVDQAD